MTKAIHTPTAVDFALVSEESKFRAFAGNSKAPPKDVGVVCGEAFEFQFLNFEKFSLPARARLLFAQTFIRLAMPLAFILTKQLLRANGTTSVPNDGTCSRKQTHAQFQRALAPENKPMHSSNKHLIHSTHPVQVQANTKDDQLFAWHLTRSGMGMQ